MKFLILFLILSFSIQTFAQDRRLFYKIEKGDSFGTVILSLGYLKLWSGSAYVNKFKNKISPRMVDKVEVGDKVYFNESEIIFKKNVIINGDQITFNKKIKKLQDWRDMMAEEQKLNAASEETPSSPALIILEKKDETRRVYDNDKDEFNFYAGAGAFVARDIEADRSTTTTTMTGFQPLLQLKGIYSHTAVGSLAFDFFAKKIFNSEFSFPVNTDFRFQYIPKWIDLGPVNFALSYSMLKHSYVGKPEDEELEYELSANFLGIGLVWPKGTYWYEIYLERAMGSKTKSKDQSISLNDGWRVDSELIYPLGTKWRIIPGLNYYSTKNDSKKYQMTVLELRSTLAYEF